MLGPHLEYSGIGAFSKSSLIFICPHGGKAKKNQEHAPMASLVANRLTLRKDERVILTLHLSESLASATI